MILTVFGDWLEANALGLVIVIVGWASSLAVLSWRGSQLAQSAKDTQEAMEALTESFTSHREEFHAHVADASKHVNTLYLSTLDKRIDKLENTVEKGLANMSDKIERLADKMAK